jgi:hypothetical protein
LARLHRLGLGEPMRTFNTGREDATLGPLRACLICAEPSLQWPFGLTTGPANASSIHGELVHVELIIILLNNLSHFGIKQTPKSPMPGHRGLFSRSRPNRDSPISRDPGQIGIGVKSRVFSRSRPNRDRENPGHFPGQIGAGRGGIRGFGVLELS